MEKLSEKYFKQLVYSKEEIQEATSKLAKHINEKYADSKDLVVVSTMLGAVPFSMDLLKEVEVLHQLDFISVKSYFGGDKQAAVVMLDKDIDLDIKGKEVIVLEDIIDSGRTLARILDLINSKEPKSLEVVSLLKREMNNVNIPNLTYGIEVPVGLFLVGYGLDYDHMYRNFEEIGILKDEFVKRK